METPMTLLKGNFTPAKEVKPEDTTPTKQAEYEKKAKDSIGGSMVFVERAQVWWDGKV